MKAILDSLPDSRWWQILFRPGVLLTICVLPPLLSPSPPLSLATLSWVHTQARSHTTFNSFQILPSRVLAFPVPLTCLFLSTPLLGVCQGIPASPTVGCMLCVCVCIRRPSREGGGKWKSRGKFTHTAAPKQLRLYRYLLHFYLLPWHSARVPLPPWPATIYWISRSQGAVLELYAII